MSKYPFTYYLSTSHFSGAPGLASSLGFRNIVAEEISGTECYVQDVLAISQSTMSQGNTKQWPQPAAWPHPFFIRHWTPDRRGIVPSIPDLQHQYLLCTVLGRHTSNVLYSSVLQKQMFWVDVKNQRLLGDKNHVRCCCIWLNCKQFSCFCSFE